MFLGFWPTNSNILKPSGIKLFHRKIYKVAASEGLGVIETTDLKSREEILNLKKEIESIPNKKEESFDVDEIVKNLNEMIEKIKVSIKNIDNLKAGANLKKLLLL